MAERRVLKRLLRLRALEEEQSLLALEAAVGNRNRVSQELSSAIGRQVEGRRSFVASLPEKDTAGRTGAVIAMEQAGRHRARLEPRLQAADAAVARSRDEYLARRTGRRQVETLVDQNQAATEEQAGRRAQQMLDEWFGRRIPRRPAGPAGDATSGFQSGEATAGEAPPKSARP